MSRPAAPASRRKQAVAAVSLSGQVDLVDDVAAPHRGEGHLGRRDGPEVVPLDVVGLVLELGQVPGRDHRVGEHQGRRSHLLELAGVMVEGEARESPQQAGTGAPEQREHGAGQLGPAFHVEQTEGRTHLPVRDPLRLGVGGGFGRPRTDDRVVLRTGAVGGVGRRQVGQLQQRLADGDLRGFGVSGGGVLVVADAATLGGELLGPVGVPGPPCVTDFLGEGLDLCPEVVTSADGGPSRGCRARPERSISAGSTPRRASARATEAASSRTNRMSIMSRTTVA